METRSRLPAALFLRAGLGAAVTGALLCTLLISCGRRQTRPWAPVSRTPRISAARATVPTLVAALSEIDSAPVPVGVDAKLYATLKEALKRELIARRTGGKLASRAPKGKQNAVTDLAAVWYHGGKLASVAWTEALGGDYNNDGSVDIGDLSPVARYYGQDIYRGAYDGHRLVVGDGNPEIGIGDLGAIAANYGFHIQGYQVVRGRFNGSGIDWEASPRPDSADRMQTAFSMSRSSKLPTDRRLDYVYVDDISDIADRTSIRYKVIPYGDGTLGDESNVAAVRPTDEAKRSIFGTVTALLGDAVEGATVTVTPGGWSALTQADGSYAISGLDEGDYTITPSFAGYVFIPPTRAVTLEGGDATGQDFTAAPDTPSHSVAGRVALGDGTGVSGALVALFPGGQSALTASDGTFAVAGVHDAAYTLTPAMAGYTFSPLVRTLTVSGADATGMDFTATPIPRTHTILGTVATTSTGVEDVTLTLNPMGATAVTSADGAFAVARVPDGAYTLVPSREGYEFTPPERTVNVSGADVTGMDFFGMPIVPAYSVSGTVARPTGEGVEGVEVKLSPGGQTATTGPEGKYVIAGVGNGSCTLLPYKADCVFSPDHRDTWVSWDDVTGMDFVVFDKWPSISGTVTLAGGGALEGVTVSLSPSGRTATTAAAGTYGIRNVPNGQYTVIPSKPGFKFSPDSRLENVADTELTDQDFTAVAAHSISGRATMADGTGVSYVTLVTEPPSGYAQTHADGSYTIELVPDGDYVVTPYYSSYIFDPPNRPVGLHGADSVGNDFTAYHAHTIYGYVSTSSGSWLDGVTVTLEPGGKTTTTAYSWGPGNYSFYVKDGNYTLTPSKPGYSFSPSQRNVTVNGSDVYGQNFTVLTFSTSGTITLGNGHGLSGAFVTLMPIGNATTTAADGTYNFQNLLNGKYVVTPIKLGCRFQPSSRLVIVDGADVPGQDFAARGGLSAGPWPKFRGNALNTGLGMSNGAESASVRWTYQTGGAVRSSPSLGGDGHLYIGSNNGNLYALDASTGALVWQGSPGGQVTSSPAVAYADAVYVGSTNGNLYSYTPSGGSLRWFTGCAGPVNSSPAVGDDATVYVGGPEIYAVASTGSNKWSYTTSGAVDSSPAIGPDGTIYAGSGQPGCFLYALNADGSLKWEFAAGGGIDSSPAIDSGGDVYFACSDGNVYSLSSDGALRWKSPLHIDGLLSPAIGADGTVFIGGSDGYVRALNPLDGSMKMIFPAGVAVTSSLAVGVDGSAYFGCGDGTVFALAPDFSLKWTYTTGGPVKSSPGIGADGTIYVGSDDGCVYAFGP